jgi:hypothetical protein
MSPHRGEAGPRTRPVATPVTGPSADGVWPMAAEPGRGVFIIARTRATSLTS